MINRDARVFRAKDFKIELGLKTHVMGIVNVTPDSFSDGGEAFAVEEAVARATGHFEAGAAIVDIGGESTRPGSQPVSLDEELARVIPVIKALAGRTDQLISIDTYKSAVADEALKAGASIVNDISGGTFDEAMPEVVRKHNAGVVLMHIKGTPRDMQSDPQYDDVLEEVREFLRSVVDRFQSAGVDKDRILVDPGIGFGKKLTHNLQIMKNLDFFAGIGAGILYGPSRKSFIGLLTGKAVKERLAGSLAAVTVGAIYGADVIRVHDVPETVQALQVIDAIRMTEHR